MLLSDDDARHNAVFTEDHAFVWASAGTGKTHTLTLRALVLVWRFGGAGLFTRDRSGRLRAAREAARRVVLTTFTRKAAAEMQTRLFRYLDLFVRSEDLDAVAVNPLVRNDRLFAAVARFFQESSPDGSFEQVRLGAEALAEVASELQISTLHSFAAGILRRHPVESGLPVGCRFAREDEDQPEELREQLLERWWQNEALLNGDVQELLDAVLGEIPLGDIRTWLQLSLEKPWIVDRACRAIPTEGTATNEFVAAMQSLAECLEGLSGAKLKRTGAQLRGLLEGSGVGRWQSLCRFLIENEGYLFDSRPSSLEKSLNALSQGARSVLDDFDRIYAVALSNVLGNESKGIWAAWCQLLEGFRDWAAGAGVREQGVVSFDDMIRLAVGVLKEHPEVRRVERERIGALLVDEFQDTDPLQLELLTLLLRDPPSARTRHEVLGFFVGDDKQSIYRFRGADVGSVLGFARAFREDLPGQRPCREFHLQTSFRSDPRVLEFVNEFFAEPLDLAPETARLSPFREGGSERPQWFVLSDETAEGKMHAAAAREAAAQATLGVIRMHLDEGFNFRDFLVLGRNGWEVNALLPVLNRAGIPVVSLGAKTFFRQPEVLDTLNLLIALHHPGDSLAVSAVLRSPLLLLDDPTIDDLIRRFGAAEIFFGKKPLETDLAPVPRRRIEDLRALARERTRADPTNWLAALRRLIPVFAYLDPQDHEGRAMARIDRLLTAFRNECLDGTTTPLVWLLTQRRRAARADAWDAQLGEDVALADETIDAVRVMTIHKAKGLEGRIVIVFDWGALLRDCLSGRRPRGEGLNCLEHTASDGRTARELRLPWGATELRTPAYRAAVRLERELQLQEARRLAYVAATRARDRLILLHPLTRDTAGLVDSREGALRRGLIGSSLLRTGESETHPHPPVPATFDEEAYLRIWTHRLAGGEFSSEPLLNTPTSSERGAAEMAPPEGGALPMAGRHGSMREGRSIGSLVHAYLERGAHLEQFEPDLLDGVVAEAGLDAEPAAVRIAEQTLRRYFDGELRDDSGRAFAQRIRSGRILGREVPVYLEKEGRRWHGVIDLVLEEGGKFVGVDYKTGRPADPLPDSYRRQREVYTAALQGALPDSRVEFEFWWLY